MVGWICRKGWGDVDARHFQASTLPRTWAPNHLSPRTNVVVTVMAGFCVCHRFAFLFSLEGGMGGFEDSGSFFLVDVHAIVLNACLFDGAANGSWHYTSVCKVGRAFHSSGSPAFLRSHTDEKAFAVFVS